jgi:hypothetical protein
MRIAPALTLDADLDYQPEEGEPPETTSRYADPVEAIE